MYVHYIIYMVVEISLSYAFQPRSNIGTDKSAHSQAQPYGICNRVIYLTQTHLHIC